MTNVCTVFFVFLVLVTSCSFTYKEREGEREREREREEGGRAKKRELTTDSQVTCLTNALLQKLPCRGIGGVLSACFGGYWWVLVGIGGYW